MFVRKLALVGLLVLSSLRSERAHAQDASTRALAADLFEQGRADMQAGRHEAACPKFEESLRLDSQIGTKLNLAHCYEQVRRVASAWALYTEVLETAKHTDDRAFAEAAAARLKPRVPRLTIQASSLPGFEVKLDGSRVTPGLPLVVDPGLHKVEFAATGRLPASREVTAVEGKVVTVDVPQLEEPARREAPTGPSNHATNHAEPPDDEETASESRSPNGWLSTKRKLALGVGGAGVVALTVGLGFGLRARSEWKEAHANGHCSADHVCDETGFALVEDAYSSARISTIGVGVGLAAVGVAAFLWTTGAPTPPDELEEVSVSPLFRAGLLGASIQGIF